MPLNHDSWYCLISLCDISTNRNLLKHLNAFGVTLLIPEFRASKIRKYKGADLEYELENVDMVISPIFVLLLKLIAVRLENDRKEISSSIRLEQRLTIFTVCGSCGNAVSLLLSAVNILRLFKYSKFPNVLNSFLLTVIFTSDVGSSPGNLTNKFLPRMRRWSFLREKNAP